MKKRMLVVLFTLFAAFAVFSEEAQLPRLAVVEFAVNDIQNTKLVNDSVAVRNQVQSNIVKTGRYDVIARAEIDQLLKEQEIQASSISSKENLKKLKLQNIDYIITGTVDAMDNDYLVSISLLDVGTGKFAHSDEEFMGNSSASLYKGTQVLVSRFVGELKDSGTEITSEKKRVRKEATIATGIHIETGLGGILFMYDSSGWGEWKELSALWDNDAYDILIERPGTYRLKLRLANGSELFRTVEFAIRGVVNVDFTLPPEDFMIDSITGTTATLSWTPSNNSSGYEIRYYNAESVDNPLTVKDISKDTGKYVIKDLKPNMNYSFCLYSKEYSIYSVPAVINKNTSDLKLNDVNITKTGTSSIYVECKNPYSNVVICSKIGNTNVFENASWFNTKIVGNEIEIDGLSQNTTYYLWLVLKENNQLGVPSECIEFKTPESQVGKVDETGGYIFYDKGFYSDGWRYLEAAPSSCEFSATWGPYDDATYIRESSVGSGKRNTEYLRQRGVSKYPAAEGCIKCSYGGKNDWFLPSEREVYYMYWNLYKKGIGNFSGESRYWSSTESDKNASFYINFKNGDSSSHQYWSYWSNCYIGAKGSDYKCLVRPVRAY